VTPDHRPNRSFGAARALTMALLLAIVLGLPGCRAELAEQLVFDITIEQGQKREYPLVYGDAGLFRLAEGNNIADADLISAPPGVTLTGFHNVSKLSIDASQLNPGAYLISLEIETTAFNLFTENVEYKKGSFTITIHVTGAGFEPGAAPEPVNVIKVEAGDSDAFVTWDPPSDLNTPSARTSADDPTLHYTFYYQPDAGATISGSVITIGPIPPTARYYLVQGLVNGVRHCFYVTQTKLELGESAPGATLCATPAYLAIAPVEISRLELGATTTTVHWLRPADFARSSRDYPTQHYVLYSRIGPGVTKSDYQQRTTDIPPGLTSFTVARSAPQEYACYRMSQAKQTLGEGPLGGEWCEQPPSPTVIPLRSGN